MPLTQRPLTRAWFAIYIDSNGLGHPRLGIAISKRLTPKACDRNRIKRLVRESFRRFTATTASMDVVVRLRKPLLSEGIEVARGQLDGMLKEAMGIK